MDNERLHMMLDELRGIIAPKQSVTIIAIGSLNARIVMYHTQKGDVIIPVSGTATKAAVIEEDVDNLLLSQNFIGIFVYRKLICII